MRWRDWIIYKILKYAKVDEGSIMPSWLRIIHALLRPVWFIRWVLMYEVGSIKLDFASDVIEIFGMRYSRHLFVDWAEGGLPEGTLFRLVRRENKTIVLERVSENATARKD